MSCGRPLQLDAPEGLCPVCLLTLGSGSAGDPSAPTISTAHSADESDETSPRLHQGSTWGDYRIGRLLGRGGMGEVYEAEQLQTGRRRRHSGRGGEAARPRSVSRSDLLDVDGGPAFVARLDAFLAKHGHLGQPCDDFAFPSWVEEPSLYLTELAKRIDRPATPAEERRTRLRGEADALAARTRERLADRPDDLARFERLLTLARDIGPLTEGHNYWIDRMAQSRLRQLSMRIGRRLARRARSSEPDDVLFLDRAEVAAVLVSPRDRRAVVAERRERHARQQELRPPTFVGKAPDRGPGRRPVRGAARRPRTPDELRGTGASAGVVRGTARVALGSEDFGRVQPGDIIVCPSSNPSWVPVFAIAGGLVTNTGGVIRHAAVVAREFGLPAVVGIANATMHIADGRLIEIDGRRGIVQLL